MIPLKGLLGTLRIQSEGSELEELPCPAFPLHAQPTKLSLSPYLLSSNLARNRYIPRQYHKCLSIEA